MRYSSQVKPISYLKANAAEVLARLAERREPLVITQNGEAKAVIQDVASYEETQETLALLKILALGNAEIEAGIIFKQQPGPGEQIEKGTPVQYVVSRGVETTTVPNVVGMTKQQAEAKLRAAGFRVRASDAFSESVPAGKVISQNPQEKLTVAVGSVVSIVVSKGAERVSVPDVIGRTAIDAKAVLEAAGFKVELQYEPHSEAGTVLEQSPSPGTSVAKGSTVTLLVDQTAPQ